MMNNQMSPDFTSVNAKSKYLGDPVGKDSELTQDLIDQRDQFGYLRHLIAQSGES